MARHIPGSGCFRKLLTLFLVLVLLAAVVLTVREAYIQYEYPVKYADIVADTAAELDVPETLVFAVIKTESGFDPEARSEVGARGLMQITEETFDWLRTKEDFGARNITFEDLDDPEVAIAYGTYFLHLLLEEFDGDIDTALSAYHAGRGSVHSWLEQAKYSKNGRTLDDIPKEDTAYYVQKVNRARGVYEKRLQQDAESNETLKTLRDNYDKFVDTYVVPHLQNLFEKLS